jgi:SAM-dependent methyltransferase
MIKRFLIFLFPSIYKKLNNKFERGIFIENELKKLQSGYKILDAGCGSQQYKKYCAHLDYFSQDIGEYTISEKKEIGNNDDAYNFGKIDYLGNIWDIDVPNESFDAVLCSEVFEHIPYPIKTIKEFERILKPGGILILTAPSNCLRHLDPFFFTTGFSDRWFEKILPENGLEISLIETVGDYYSFMATEVSRTIINSNPLSSILLLPSFLYYFFKKPTELSKNTLVTGYHLTAKKKL